MSETSVPAVGPFGGHRRLRVASKLVLAAALLLFVAPAAEAYIDPGTGSALVYVVSGVVVSLYFAARGLYYRLLDLAFRIRFRDQNCAVALHCEDPRYESTFLPVLKALVARGIQPTFFTMYERDGSCEALSTRVSHRSIPPGMLGYAYLNNLEATVLVTTTPQLDVMTFRRSRRVAHYIHVPHGLGECRYVRPYAYDYFDTVLCCGRILKTNIRRMEAIRGTPAKRLLETGIPHYEALAATARQAPPPLGRPVVLVAPSWGPLSMFESFDLSFVQEIARRHAVIVRPHPQMRISQPELYARIVALDGVTVDTERTPSAAMSAASLLLSDISGIAHEFAFIYERPVLVIDQKTVTGGLEGELLGGDSELKETCRDFIVPVPPSEMPNILTWIERVLADHRAERIAEARKSLIYNYGNASEVAAEQITEIYRRLRQRTAARSWSGRWGHAATRVVRGSRSERVAP